MEVSSKQVRHYRLQAHHLTEKGSLKELLKVSGACGFQNSPPGAWENAAFQRINCTLQELQKALYQEKSLLQAWSFRGVPVVFPTDDSETFLTALCSKEGEQPWIYTRGISDALDYLGMTFEEVFDRLKAVIPYLDKNTLKSKNQLDQVLAELIYKELPKRKQELWQGPSMYGDPEKQTVGEAAVSFLLRPCSFSSLVVFGERSKSSPTFTSFKNWTGSSPTSQKDPEEQLVRKFLHSYGPSTVKHFTSWLGCSPKQGLRLWKTIEDEIMAVKVDGTTSYLLKEDKESLENAEVDEKCLVLLSAHDPFLDLKDRAILLADKDLQKKVWRFVANPGAVLQGGEIIGIWKSKKTKEQIELTVTTWEKITAKEKEQLNQLAEEMAAFRQLKLKSCNFEINK